MRAIKYLPRSSHPSTSSEHLGAGTATLSLGILAAMENWKQARIFDN